MSSEASAKGDQSSIISHPPFRSQVSALITQKAPAPDHRWQVSKLIDPRRSNGEQQLSELTGKTLLLPKDPAFHPDAKGLKWRVRNLVA